MILTAGDEQTDLSEKNRQTFSLYGHQVFIYEQTSYLGRLLIGPASLPLFVSLVLSGKTKGGSITVPLTSCLTGLDQSVLQIKTKIVSGHTADFKPVKHEVNGAVILPPLVFPAPTIREKIRRESVVAMNFSFRLLDHNQQQRLNTDDIWMRNSLSIAVFIEHMMCNMRKR